MVSQQNTDAVLRQELSDVGGAVEMDCELVALAQDRHTVTASVVRTGTNETISARYLVGCDGGASSVRKCVDLPFTGETWEEAACYLIGNLSATGFDREHWHVWTDPDWGYLTLQPIIHGDTWLFVATIQREELAGYLEPTAQSMQSLFERRLPTATVSFRDLTWHSVYRRNLRIVDRYRSGRVFLAGDSAHVGVEHGMNIGIQDACNLSWKLAQVLRGAPGELLDTYEEERQIARRILDSTLARDQGNSGNAAAAKSLTNAVLNKDPANDPTQLTVAYRDSSLSHDFEPVTGLRAGDRALDAPGLMAVTGQPRRLFEILDRSKFTLLQFSNGPAIESPFGPALTVYKLVKSSTQNGDAQTLLDAHGHAHRAYGISAQALVLIRPDGYIGSTGTIASLSAMLRHLRTMTFSPAL
jgi:2-polyprenyl-6-methoxyphenol hydroxylase-like FAD-dependent oxidoreductase